MLQLYALLVVYAVLAAIWAYDKQYVWDHLYQSTTSLLTMWLVLRHVRTQSEWGTFADVVTWPILALLLWRIVLARFNLLESDSLISDIEGKNALTPFAFLGLLMSFARVRQGAIWHVPIIVFYLSAIALSLALKAIASAALFLILTLPAFISFSRRGLTAFIAVLLSLGLAVIPFSNSGSQVAQMGAKHIEYRTLLLLDAYGIDTELSNDQKTDLQVSLRQDLIRTGLEYWMEKPLLGHGTNQFRHLWLRDRGWSTQPHNTWVELLVSFGVIGTLIYASILAVLLRRIIRVKDTSPITAIMLAWLLAMMVFGYAQPIWQTLPIMLGLVLSNRVLTLSAISENIAQNTHASETYAVSNSGRGRTHLLT
jgi:O-antigen ligase